MHSDTHSVVLTTVLREVEAALIVAALEEKGVIARQSGGSVSGFKVGAPAEVTIYVRPEDHDKAVQAYAEIREEAGHIDWSQVDLDSSEE